MRFFAEASTLLSSSLDHVSICERLAHLVVPSFADWCGVELAEEGELRSIAIAHVDSAKVAVAREMRRRYPPDPPSARGPHAVLRTGRPELIAEISPEMLERGARQRGAPQLHPRPRAAVGADRARWWPAVGPSASSTSSGRSPSGATAPRIWR